MPAMVSHLYRVQPTRPEMLTSGPTQEEERSIDAHFAYLKELIDQGLVLLAGRTLTTGPDTFGIVLMAVDSDAQAEAIMLADPAVQAQVMRADCLPFSVVLNGWQS